jgi:CheY-like chemotaxis protein
MLKKLLSKRAISARGKFEKAPFKNCLFIDDHFLDIFMNTKTVQTVNFAENSVSVKFAKEALKILQDKKIVPDLILVDIMMREMDGFDFVEQYKQIGLDIKKTKIYMLSSSEDPADIKRAEDDKCITGFIQKPLTPQKLMELGRCA